MSLIHARLHHGEHPGRAVARPVLHHIGITTADLPAMVEWYARVLDMTPTHRSEPGAGPGPRWRTTWLTNDRANHRVAIMALPGLAADARRSGHTGFHHIAFEYPGLDDLLAAYARLRDAGIEPARAADHGPTTSLYYADPDGNTVELLVDNFGDGARSGEFMRTSPDFADNPTGTDVDPEQLHAARAAGMTAAELHDRAYAGEFCSARGYYGHCLVATTDPHGVSSGSAPG